MNRYVIYRCPEKCNCHQRLNEHELIGATTANSFEEAMPEIFEQSKIDLQSIQDSAFSDGNVDFKYIQEVEHSRKYQYSFEARLFPEHEMSPINPWRIYAVQEIPEE